MEREAGWTSRWATLAVAQGVASERPLSQNTPPPEGPPSKRLHPQKGPPPKGSTHRRVHLQKAPPPEGHHARFNALLSLEVLSNFIFELVFCEGSGWDNGART